MIENADKTLRLSRRHMIQSLCGGLGSVGLTALLGPRQADAAAVEEVGDVQRFVNGVHVLLAAAERDRGQPAGREPVGVERMRVLYSDPEIIATRTIDRLQK